MKNKYFTYSLSFKKAMISFLGISLALNNITITASYANSDIQDRYQTLKGEYITIENSTPGNLEDIEVFGNTIQDSDNLTDIQSVGELYVDDKGSPILDKQGRKQYKLDVYSQNTPNGMRNISGFSKSEYSGTHKRESYNIFSISNINSKGSVFNNYTGIYFKVDNVDDSLIGKQVKIKFKLLEISGEASSVNATVSPYKWNNSGTERFNLNVNEYQTKIVNITKLAQNTPLFVFEVKPTSLPVHAKAQIEVIVLDDTYNTNTTTILLPCQLQKVGDISDRLYWDNEKKRYIVEKKINQIYTDGYEKIDYANKTAYFNANWGNLIPKESTSMFLEKYGLHRYYKNSTWNSVVLHSSWKKIILRPSPGNPAFDFSEDFLNSIVPGRIYYQLETPILIDTNVLSKIKVVTYEDETHIFAQEGTEAVPTLSVTIDRLPQMAKESIRETEVNSTSLNIARSRMYVNMLPESLYKDKLQEQLNLLFSSDIIFEKKDITNNLDIYIKSENMLSLGLDTNTVTFSDFSGVEEVEKENVINLAIGSSLPYKINAYLENEIQNSDKSKTMDKSMLNIKENGEAAYKEFNNIKTKLVLKDSCVKGNGINHGIDIRLKGNKAFESDVYKTVIRLEVEQK